MVYYNNKKVGSSLVPTVTRGNPYLALKCPKSLVGDVTRICIPTLEHGNEETFSLLPTFFVLKVFILKTAVHDIELPLLQPGVTLESVGIKRRLVNDICNAP